MYLIKVGKRIINVAYLILAEEWDGTEDTAALTPGDVRVTLESGRVINLRNGDAREFLRRVDAVLPCDPPSDGTIVQVGREYDPVTGKPVANPTSPPDAKRSG